MATKTIGLSLRSIIYAIPQSPFGNSLLAGSGSPSVASQRLPNGEHLYQREP